MVVDLTKCTTCEGTGLIEWTPTHTTHCPDCVGEIRRLRGIMMQFGFLPEGVLDASPLKRIEITAP